MKFLNLMLAGLLMLTPMIATAVEDVDPQNSEALKDLKGLVVIEFYTEDCPACKRMAPMLDEAEEKYKGRVHFRKISLTKYPRVGDAFKIQAVPAMLIIDNNKNRVMGMVTGVPPTQADLNKLLDLTLLKALEK